MEHVRQVQLALLLAEADARFVIVGGTARLLRGTPHTPNDLDIVVSPTEIAKVEAALAELRRAGQQLLRGGGSPQRVLTSWAPVDVFVKDDLPTWHTVEIDGTRLRVAD